VGFTKERQIQCYDSSNYRNQTITLIVLFFQFVYRDELRNEDVALRLNSVRRLGTIALALGEERTRRELIPFLNDNNDDEDEVLLSVAEELGKFVPLIGGPEYAHFLLLPLETLASVDETVVRDRAVESLCTIGLSMPDTHLIQYFIPLIKRLASKEWTARVSACRLFAIAYPRVAAEVQTDLRAGFVQLCRDETPMVRRAAASALGAFADVIHTTNDGQGVSSSSASISSIVAGGGGGTTPMPPASSSSPSPPSSQPATQQSSSQSFIATDLLPVFLQLTSDDQDSVRLIAVEACTPLGKVLPISIATSDILPVLQRFSEDKSWRVRWNVAQQIPELSETLGSTIMLQYLLEPYIKLLRDSEAEVRAAAAEKIAAMAKLMPADLVLQQFILAGPAKELAGDASQYVRGALASVVTELAPMVGKEATNKQLLPIFLELLKDDWPDVRLGVIGKLDALNAVIGIQALSDSLLPAIQELSDDKHWRVRLAIIGHIPLLAAQLGAEFFDAKLGPQCLVWLQDGVFSIREAAIKCIADLAKEFGPDWTKDHLVEAVLSLGDNKNYLHRITVLHAAAALGRVVSMEVLSTLLLPAVVKGGQDGVPNVRFNAAKVLEQMLPFLNTSMVDQLVKPHLNQLMSDPDQDVRYFATRAMNACEYGVAAMS